MFADGLLGVRRIWWLQQCSHLMVSLCIVVSLVGARLNAVCGPALCPMEKLHEQVVYQSLESPPPHPHPIPKLGEKDINTGGGGGVPSRHTPTPSHFPANFRAGGGGAGSWGGLGLVEGEGGTRTPTYMAYNDPLIAVDIFAVCTWAKKIATRGVGAW